ncbi:retrotransposon protein, putative, ty1-copia subclass [Tanacetum coccineum]
MRPICVGVTWIIKGSMGFIAIASPTHHHIKGVSDRRNRTLLDMVRSMMSQTTIPKSFWDYALDSASRISPMIMIACGSLEDLKSSHKRYKSSLETSLIPEELKRSIYGLKQASSQWNKRFDDEIKKFSFTQNHDEPCVYQKASGSYVTFLILYVDDILIMGNNIPMLQDVKSYLGKCFAKKDLGEAAYILGIKIYQDRSKWLIGLCQSAYIEKILKRYYIENSKRGTIPMQEKLKLSKSDGASTPAKMRCMSNIPSFGCWFKSCMALRVSCYTDAGYLTDADDLKSQTGYVFLLNGGAVDWKSTKQSIFATSSIDAKYIAAFDASKEAVWIHKFIYGLNVVPTIEEPI